MSSTFFGLTIAKSGLTAASVAQNTTANNIANVETEGYSKQTVLTAASDALRTFTTYGCAGAGVETIAIERIRDEFYDYKYWNNNSNLGEYDVKKYYMSSIENYFADDDTTKGFNTIFDSMYTALSEIQKSSGDDTSKTEFIGEAASLAEYFKTLANNLQNLQSDVNDEMKTKVDEINSLAQEIATLNGQINVIELNGNTANELRDKRTVLIDELSAITDVTVTETPIYNNSGKETGVYNYIVGIAGGQTLVEGSAYNQLECVARTALEKANQSDADGLYNIQWTNGLSFGLYGDTVGGELGALIDMRDGNNGENFTGKVSSVDTTKNTVTVDVTEDYLKDLDKCTLSENGGKISIGNYVYYYDSFTYNYDKTAGTYSYTFALNTDKTSAANIANLTNRTGQTATVGASVDYQGIPYYVEQLNEFVRKFASAFNKILTQTGAVDSYGDAAGKLFTGDNATNTAEYSFGTSYAGTTGSVSSKDDSYYKLTAFNFTVTDAMQNNCKLLATHTDAGAGQDKYDVIEDLVDLKTNTDKMSFRGCSASEFLQCLTSDTSLNAEKANTFYSNYNTISSTIINQRLSVSGVDNDEEAADLVKFQNAYNLASKMIQTLTEMYDRLILETGV